MSEENENTNEAEKHTDYYMLNLYNKVFNHLYHTKGNKKLFGSKIPDGWDIINKKTLIIIEDKRENKYKIKGKKQLFTYYDNMTEENKQKYQTYLILSYGTDEKTFEYFIFDDKKKNLNITLKELYDNINPNNKSYDEKNIHKINNYIHKHMNLQKAQKLLFISSILLCLDIDINILSDYNETTNNYVIANKIVETLQKYYNDNIFSNTFIFLLKSLHNKHLYKIFQMIKEDINIYSKDILNMFYTEFCIWDIDDEAKLGVVLTPNHIVKLMIDLLNIKQTDKLLDFCTGTGSFLIEGSKYTKKLYGCENNDMRYTLAKINFILHKLNYDNIIYSSCFDYNYITGIFDKIIFNPPYHQDSYDENNNNNNTCNWKNYNMVPKFILYGVELLKVGGLGCCIVPRSYFNNNQKDINEFKKEFLKHCKILKIINCIKNPFYPIGTDPAIILFEKTNEKNDNNLISENVEIIKYDDGYKIFKNTRIIDKNTSSSMINQFRNLNYNDDWNYINDINIDNIINILKKNIISNYTNLLKNKIEINDLNLIYNEMIDKLKEIENMNIKQYKTIKIKNIAQKEKTLKKVFKINETEDGIYPLISSTMYDNGICKKINDYNYDCKNNNIISVARNGSVGYCFVQTGKIGITTDVILLKLTNNSIDKYILSILLTHYLSSQYSYGNKLTIPKLLNTEINYPIF